MAVSLLPRNCWCFTGAMPFRMNVHTPCAAAPFPHVRADWGQACVRYPGSVSVSSVWVSWAAITSGQAVGASDLKYCCRIAFWHRNPLAF
ncbi:hypothetical protein MRX96_015284 [Rhipicephalus microplus]